MSTTSPDYAAINAAFQALSSGDKRRAIAQDVLARLERGQLQPMQGTWTHLRRGEETIDKQSDSSSKEDLQSALDDPTVTCRCCALGGMICGLAHFEDQITLRDAYFDATRERLFALFGEEQVRLIECAFECGSGEMLASGLDLRDDAVEFGCRYRDPHARFLAIWTAIANHPEGLFDVVALSQATNDSP